MHDLLDDRMDSSKLWLIPLHSTLNRSENGEQANRAIVVRALTRVIASCSLGA